MSTARPIFYLLAGLNGAGESTLHKALVNNGDVDKALESVNAALYERSYLQHVVNFQKRSEVARDWVDTRHEGLPIAKTGFVSETVFSHEFKLVLITQAQVIGFDVVL